MDQSLLRELQQLRSYPSITVLMNTTPGSKLLDDQVATARELIGVASERLEATTESPRRNELIGRLHNLVSEREGQRAGHAVALCVSPEHCVAVSLGGAVNQRVVIDETFATRDLVADANRTAAYRVVTVSDSNLQVFLGDRQRLVEEGDEQLPLRRRAGTSPAIWACEVREVLERLEHGRPMPLVVAGVKRTVTRLVGLSSLSSVGYVAGNHDRTGRAQLHTLVWPLVVDWKKRAQQRSLDRLDHARSARRFASGVTEVWTLANEGRIDLLVVETG
jgi:hypothetical protein